MHKTTVLWILEWLGLTPSQKLDQGGKVAQVIVKGSLPVRPSDVGLNKTLSCPGLDIRSSKFAGLDISCH